MSQPNNSRTFYKDLPPVLAGDGLCDISLHKVVPGDWSVVVVDIVGSTQAIEKGQYKDVNMISASSITAVLNAAGREEIAYIFGGDGATLLVPSELMLNVACALYGTRQMSEGSFGLSMRAGVVRVGELEERGAPVRVAKTEIAPGVFHAAMSGEGISLAEKLVKGKEAGETAEKYDITSLFDVGTLAARPVDFTGLECRWQPLHSQNGLDVSLIIVARNADEAKNAALYQRVLGHIQTICGSRDSWRPASTKNLKVSVNPARLSGEAKVRAAGQDKKGYFKSLARVFLQSWIGKTCLWLGLKAGKFDGKTYQQATAQNTDYIKFDNALRLVMDITPAQKDALAGYLESLVASGEIFYGLHTAPAALMTCLVFDYGSDHFHFVDGADGGYALAAKQLKKQIKDAGGA